MARRKIDKDQLLKDMGAHVLANGLNTASLRPLAEAAGTSDRMLIYHFGNKNDLVAALLQHLAQDLAAKMDAVLPPVGFAAETELVEALVAILRSDAGAPYMRVWLDIISAATNGSTLHREAGHVMLEGYLDWLTARLPAGTPDPALSVRKIMLLIEGTLVLDAVGQSDAADKARMDFLGD